ncbi:hypothetical protein ACH5RR_026836 [Cinchona calisaya]|uniref:Alpha/beta hydrolase fold-3 domain-containing protein n=1 Tax=Cinchona calisaya TaxID=153742 RepID=A0ABD2Z5P4_9GENT
MDDKATKTKPDLPFKIRLLISASQLIGKLSVRSDGTINRRIFSFFDQKVKAPYTRVIDNVPVSASDILVDPSRDIWFRLFVPETNSSDDRLPLIVFFHGGGFAYCGPDSGTFDSLCCNLAAQIPAIIASVNYRLAPEHRFPCAYDDGYDALKYIEAQNYAILPAKTDLRKCFIAGDSAGGNLAHHVTHRASQNSHEFEKIKIIGLLAMQPFFGGEERTPSELRLTTVPFLNMKVTDRMWKNFLPEGADRNHEATNVFGGGANSEAEDTVPDAFPSSLVFVGGFDPLQDWQKRYCEGLRRCGKEVTLVEYPNGIHGFYTFPELPESALLVKEVREFIQKKI